MSLAVIGLFVVSALLIWQFVGYPVTMGIIALRAKPKKKDSAYTPFVSIIVPAYNEEGVIVARLENLFGLDYPKNRYEVIVVESGSRDRTYDKALEAVERAGNGGAQVKLLREGERRGKASAINLARRHARAEIIVVTDANAVFHQDVLREVMPHFADPRVGGVGGRYFVSNPDNPYSSSESFYWDLEYVMRSGESALDSACLFHGELNAWRKNLIAEADVNIISEDLDMAIRIRRKGFKIGYEPRAKVYEPTGVTASDQIIRRKKVSSGTILCIRKHLTYFLLPRDLYGLLIFPSHKGLTMLSPFLLLALAALCIVIGDIAVVATHLALTLAAFLVLLATLLHLRAKLVNTPGRRGEYSISWLAKIAYYTLLNEYLVLLAWVDVALGRHTALWETAESTRPPMEASEAGEERTH